METKRSLFALVAFLMIFTESVQSQIDTSKVKNGEILRINGKVIKGDVVSNDGEMITYHYFNSREKLFSKQISSLLVFSFTPENEPESVVYRKDTLRGNVFSEEEMRIYVYGERDGQEKTRSWPRFAIGFATSLGVSLYDTYRPTTDTLLNGVVKEKGLFQNSPSFLHFAYPLAFTIVNGAFRPKVKPHQVSDEAFLLNENYILGHQKAHRGKNLWQGLMGSVAGTATGLILQAVFKSR